MNLTQALLDLTKYIFESTSFQPDKDGFKMQWGSKYQTPEYLNHLNTRQFSAFKSSYYLVTGHSGPVDGLLVNFQSCLKDITQKLDYCVQFFKRHNSKTRLLCPVFEWSFICIMI